MKRKIMIVVTSAVLCLGVLCPVMAQDLASREAMNRTYFQSFTDTKKEPAQVFVEGYELLTAMKNGNFPPAAMNEQVNSNNVEIPLQYVQDFQDSTQGKYEIPNFNPYQDILQAVSLKKYYKEDLKHYQDLYDAIVWNKDGTPDMTKTNTVKAYYAFYNLIRQGKPSRLRVGRIDEHFPFIGIYADSFAQLQEKFGNDDAYLWFTYVLYFEKVALYMIPKEDAKQAEEISQQMLYRDFQKYGITPEQTDEWLNFATSWGSDFLNDPSVQGRSGKIVAIVGRGNWYETIFLLTQEEMDRTNVGLQYVPFALVASHEFQHVKDNFYGQITQPSLRELTTSVKQIVESDDIYRQIHNITDTKAIEYKGIDGPVQIDLDFYGIKLGEIAVFFRNLSKKYGTDNYAQLLLTNEAEEYIKNSYNNLIEKIVSMLLIRDHGTDNRNKVSKEEIEFLRQASKSTIREIVRGY